MIDKWSITGIIFIFSSQVIKGPSQNKGQKNKYVFHLKIPVTSYYCLKHWLLFSLTQRPLYPSYF